MGAFIDLTGQRFGMWVVKARDKRKHGATFWRCVCDCGQIRSVSSTKLRNGLTKSCGCLSNHGHTAKGKTSTTYRAWKHMKERCSNPNVDSYKYYGERNISVCSRWLNSFKNFLFDMGEKPKGLTLERINNNKGYFPENCKWATRTENSRNRRNTRKIKYQGKTKCLIEWAEELGVKYPALNKRLRTHPPEIAFNM